MQEMEWLGNIEACVIFTLQYAMLSSVLNLESLHKVFFRKNRFVSQPSKVEMDQRLDDIIGFISILISLSSRAYLLTRDWEFRLEKNLDKHENRSRYGSRGMPLLLI